MLNVLSPLRLPFFPFWFNFFPFPPLCVFALLVPKVRLVRLGRSASSCPQPPPPASPAEVLAVNDLIGLIFDAFVVGSVERETKTWLPAIPLAFWPFSVFSGSFHLTH